jgi:PAS domain S-box-containing protein
VSAAAISVAIMTGLTLYAGAFHAFVFVRGGRKRRDLTFALIALGVSGYDLLSTVLYVTTSTEVGAVIAKAQLTVGFILIALFALFLTEYSGRPMPGWMRVVSGIHVVAALYTPFDRWGMILTATPSILRFDSVLFGPVVYYEPELGPLGAVVLALGGIALVVYLFVVSRWLARSGERRDARPLFIAGIIVLAGVAYDMLVSLRVVEEVYILPYTNAGVVLLMARILSRDVVEAARTKDALLESEARVRAILSGIPDSVVALDTHGVVIDLNPAAVELLGAPRQALVGRWIGDIGGLEDAPQLAAAEAGVELLQIRRADGSVRLVEAAESFLEDRSGSVRGSILVLHDATDQRALEQRLRQAQKLESLGRLAGGVAHDFNNMLAPILGYAQIARRKLGDDHPVAEDLEIVATAAEKAAELTRRLLALGRQQRLSLAPLDLTEVVSGMRPILERIVSEDVGMRFDLAADLPAVLADRVQIEQVLLNLVMNAADAMPAGGALTVRVQEASSDASAPSGRAVLLEVDDTGEGMDTTTADHIFEPFFTTKPRGRGTGLGLATVLGIIEQHHGRVVVSSTLGEGSVFRVSLPVPLGEPTEASVPASRPSHIRVAGRALVIEDDPLVRRMIGDVLLQQGFDVVAVRDGAGAVASADTAEGAPFDLVVSDVIMPGMNGPEVVARLRARMPALRCVFVSGHTEDALDLRGGLPPGTAFLRKPFGIDELIIASREAMGVPEPRSTSDGAAEPSAT